MCPIGGIGRTLTCERGAALDDDEPLLGGWDDAARRLVAMATASGALRDSLSQVRYLASKNAAYYRTVLDVLVEEESRLGLHLSTSEIHRRSADRLAVVVKTYVGFPDVGPLLDQLHKWGNVDRIANTQRKGSVQEYLKKDYLYQMTPAGTIVHRELDRLDDELGKTGSLQASLLPEVLRALVELVDVLGNTKIARGQRRQDAAAAFSRVVNGFTELTENAKLFVQGLNRPIDLDSALKGEAFLEYKQVVAEYLRTFTLGLARHAESIAIAIGNAEKAGVLLELSEIARIDAAPVLGISLEEVVRHDAELMRARWAGLRRWFFEDGDRPPVVRTLQERAVDAVNRIMALVRRLNEQRLGRLDRKSDLRLLARWFQAATSSEEVLELWRAGFGMYPARHFGAPHPHEDGLDFLPSTSWWHGPAVDISARLRKFGPRSRAGRPPRLTDPVTTKRFLQAKLAVQRAEEEAAAAALARRCPTALSELGLLPATEFAVLVTCLRAALSSQKTEDGSRHAVTNDGRLHVVLVEAASPEATAVVATDDGRIVIEDFVLTLTLLEVGA